MHNGSHKVHSLSQHNKQPGKENEIHPTPQYERSDDFSAKRLKGKVAIITGGDSGIGRSTAIAFAKEGADIAIFYLNEHDDAKATKKRIEEIGKRCLTIAGDAGDFEFCKRNVDDVVQKLGQLDILVTSVRH